jgi:probable HAF family extracellular repeat protein
MVTNVRPVNKGGHSTASMINNFGQVVGHGADEPRTETRAYAWSVEHGLIPDLGSVYGHASFATNINDKGVIVGYMTTATESLRAFLLGQGQMYDLGLLSPVEYDEAFSVATDINNEGHIVGYSNNSDNALRAYHWDHQNGMTDLGTLGSGRSYAYSINDAGMTVGWSQVDGKSGYRAFAWREETGMLELPGKPDLPTVAYGINASGAICGAAAVGALSNVLQAALWQDGKVFDLGTLYNLSFSSGQAINDVGHVVGWSYPSARCDLANGRAIIWDQVSGVQDLNDLIGVGTGWVLHKATGVNNEGEIVGCGAFDGKQQSFLLTPEGYARDVSKLLHLHQMSLITNQKTGIIYRMIMIKNISHKIVKGPLQLVFKDMTPGVNLVGKIGEFDGSPFRTVNTDHLSPGSQMSTTIQFTNPESRIISYDLDCYAGLF